MSLKHELLKLREAAESLDAAEDVQECLSLLNKGRPYDQMFFGRLSDPRWLPLLMKSGFFDKLPTQTIAADGTQHFPMHLPLFGLLELAQIAPGDVEAIVASLEIPDNPAIHDQVMRVVAAIKPLKNPDALVAIVKRLIKHSSGSSWLWVADVLNNWLELGELNACLQIVESCLSIAVSNANALSSTRDDLRLTEIDRQIIARIGEHCPFETAQLLQRLLVSWAKLEKNGEHGLESISGVLDGDSSDDPDFDSPPTYWLEEFGSPTVREHDIEVILANRLYFLGAIVYGSGDAQRIGKFDSLLRDDSWHLFRRLRWQLYSEFPSHTLSLARQDTIERIPRLGHSSAKHCHELALMLESHAKQHGSLFLTADEVAAYVASVLDGPIVEGSISIDSDYSDRFHFKQLFPIREILAGEALAKYKLLSESRQDVEITYKPVSSTGETRSVETIAPLVAAEMASMSDPEIWNLLNDWQPSERSAERWWEQEDVGALGAKFAELLESSSERFDPMSRWWRNISRARILSAVLDRATDQISSLSKENQPDPPVDSEWKNWFGLAAWIIEKSNASEYSSDWGWSRMTAVKFLRSAISVSDHITPEFLTEAGALLRQLFEEPEDKIRKLAMGDWLTTAINSVRGTALEGLLQFAAKQVDKGGPDPWIFRVISERLCDPNESPAIFAIMGARLRLFLFLFSDKISAEPKLVLASDTSERRTSFLTSHFLYHNPLPAALKAIPDLPNAALELLENEEFKGETRSKFGSRLGSHLGFYYWNNTFPDDSVGSRVIDRFFDVASAEIRASTIRQIANIFQDAQLDDTHQDLYARVMMLWERRFGRIENAIGINGEPVERFSAELEASIDWLKCNCFPVEWRLENTAKTLDYLEEAPRTYSIMETLESISASEQYTDHSIRIVHTLLGKKSGDSRWMYREEPLKKLLIRGISSDHQETRRLAEEAQEMLLRQGFFAYLDCGPLAP